MTGSVTGASATNLLGSGLTAGTFTGAAISDSKSSTTASASTKLSGGTSSVDGLATSLTTTDTLTINGKSITFKQRLGHLDQRQRRHDRRLGRHDQRRSDRNQQCRRFWHGHDQLVGQDRSVDRYERFGHQPRRFGSHDARPRLRRRYGQRHQQRHRFTGFATTAAGSSIAAAGSINNQTLTIGATGVGGVCHDPDLRLGDGPDLDADRAQHDARSQQPAGHNRLDRQTVDLDDQRRCFVFARRAQRYGCVDGRHGL